MRYSVFVSRVAENGDKANAASSSDLVKPKARVMDGWRVLGKQIRAAALEIFFPERISISSLRK